MKRFVIWKFAGNERTTLAMFDDKETALREGKKIYDSITEKCVVSCIRTEVDEQGSIDEHHYLVYDAWF